VTAEQEERLTLALEKLAQALAGIDETKRQEFARRWPERKEPRDAVVTRIPNEEDLIREAHGSSNESLAEWLNPPAEEELVGTREREWRRAHPEAWPGHNRTAGSAGTQVAPGDQADGGGLETPEGKA
jgi:hypothetical protein